MSTPEQPRLYNDLAPWWPLMSPPSDYVEEAAELLPILLGATTPPPATLLELGCGGGSLAFHFKPHLQLTLSDIAPGMLANSRAVNPECEHVLGDMTSLDLGREFDIVLVQDAIMFATTPGALQATMATAFRHCRAGGAAVLIPDYVKETFTSDTESGGEDGADGRGLRYLEWAWDPDPDDDTYEVVYSYVLRDADGSTRFEGERNREGLFPLASWLAWMTEAGFAVSNRLDSWGRHVFIGVKPAAGSSTTAGATGGAPGCP